MKKKLQKNTKRTRQEPIGTEISGSDLVGHKYSGKFSQADYTSGSEWIDDWTVKHQPKPEGRGDRVVDKVINDFIQRSEVGKQRYGTYLRICNGRDALIDAYQEAIDLVMYLRQAIMEREEKIEKLH